jgi:hypothetical protein
MYAVVSLNDEKYQPLADYTWNQNKQQYCERHGYEGINKTDNFVGGIPIGFEKIFFLKNLMEERRDLEWIWWTGSDAMITNHTIKIEDKIDPAYDLIIATDCNEINNDSFLIKNSDWGRAYMQSIIDVMPQYQKHYFYEQQAMIESIPLPENSGKIKIVPQRYLNAYKNDLYPHQSKYDLLGNDGTWQKGDWLIHWPGTSLDLRLQLARHFLSEVVK